MAKILVAEDDTTMRHFLAMALERAGHRVEACADGLAAMDALQKHKDFDLLLADVVMPGMDGIELSQKAAHLHPTLKIMFITGFAGVVMNQQEPSLQAARVMAKPFHLKELVDQVETLLAA